MRVLVIDDEMAVLRTVERLLSREGHEVMTAESASDAFFLLATFARSFDVILCDVHLPGMDGEAFLARLAPLDAARLAFMTGGACGNENDGMLSGREVLRKPLDAEKLEGMLEATAARVAA
jgi:CheY-like chemotaxis protein